MSAKPRLLVPYGLKTLLEGLSRAVMSAQPTNIANYALFYFTELLQHRRENPSMDFKDLVQEFQRRQDNAHFIPTENSKSGISYPVVPKDKSESEKAETEKQQCPPDQDPRAGNSSMIEAIPALLNGALNCPLLHRDISNPLVGAYSIYSQMYPNKKVSAPAIAERTDTAKCQLQEQTGSGVEASSEQKPEKLDKASSKTQSHPTPTMEKKASVSGAFPKISNDQAAYPSTRGQDLDGQCSLPRGAPSNDRRTDAVVPSPSALIPVRTISKPQNIANLPVDVQRMVSNMPQHPPDQEHSSAPGSAIYIAKQTVESRLAVPLAQGVAQLKIRSETAENQEKAAEMLSSNLYQIHISVDKPAEEVCYEPAYIPGKDASMVHIVTAIPTMDSTETSSVHYKAAPKVTPPETIQTPTVHCRHHSQHKPVYVPSLTWSSQQCICQRPPPLHFQQPAYRTTESSKYYAHAHMYKQGCSDASSHSSASELGQACSDSMGSSGNQSQRAQYMQFLFCPCMSDPPSCNVQPLLISSPTYVMSHEAKRGAGSHPSILVGSGESKTECAVHPAMPGPRSKPNTGYRMQDSGVQQDPMYVSVAVPMEELQSLSATPSITHLAETRSIPSLPAHRSAITVAVAATRCPSAVSGVNQTQCLRTKAAQDDEGFIKPSKD